MAGDEQTTTPEASENDTKEEEPGNDPSPGRAFVDRVLGAGDTFLRLVATVGGFAVANLGFDRLGKGDYSDQRWLWAAGAVTGFAVGVVLAVGAALGATRSSRVSHSWLLGGLAARRGLAKKVAEKVQATPYMMGGAVDLEGLRLALDEAMELQRESPSAFADPSSEERYRLEMLVGARDRVLDLAVAEKSQLSTYSYVMGAGVVLATLSGALFAFVTNQAAQVQDEASREEKLGEAEAAREELVAEAEELRDTTQVVTGELLPQAPSAVRIVLGADPPPATQLSDLAIGTASCDVQTLGATLIEVTTPPPDLVADAGSGVTAASVMRVVTPSTSACRAGDLWLAPSVVVRAPATTPTTSGGSSSSQDAAPEGDGGS